MQKESKQAWEAHLQSARLSGFAMRMLFPQGVQNVRRQHQLDSGEMDVTRLTRQQTYSMSMSRPSRTGAKLASWRACVPPLWDHAGLRSHLRSSPRCASQCGGNGSNDALVIRGNL